MLSLWFDLVRKASFSSDVGPTIRACDQGVTPGAHNRANGNAMQRDLDQAVSKPRCASGNTNSRLGHACHSVVLLLVMAAVVCSAEHGMGCLPNPNPPPPVRHYALNAVLPSSVDLSPAIPSVGHQGETGSCVGWAVGYYLKTQQEQAERAWGVSSSDHKFSPWWIYNQIKIGADGGSYIFDALNIVKNRGCAPLSQFNPGSPNVLPPPGDYLEYRIFSWEELPLDTNSIKSVLAAGRPAIFELVNYPDFDNLNTSNQVYDSIYGVPRGQHAVCVVGYDNAKGAFKVVNSWGTTWGVGGFGWISYALIGNSVAVQHVYSARDAGMQAISLYSSGNPAEAPIQPGYFLFNRPYVDVLPLTVSFALSGSASLSTDYSLSSSSAFAYDSATGIGTITIPANAVGATLVLTPLVDAVNEPSETVVVDLVENPQAYSVDTANRQAIQVIGNASLPVVTLASTGVLIENGLSIASGTVVFSRTSTGLASPLTVNVTLTGTANAAMDYTASLLIGSGTSRTITFPANAATMTCTFTPIEDGLFEPDENIVINAVNASAYAVAGPPNILMIRGSTLSLSGRLQEGINSGNGQKYGTASVANAYVLQNADTLNGYSVYDEPYVLVAQDRVVLGVNVSVRAGSSIAIRIAPISQGAGSPVIAPRQLVTETMAKGRANGDSASGCGAGFGSVALLIGCGMTLVRRRRSVKSCL